MVGDAKATECAELVLAEEFVEILEEADEDDEQRTGAADEKEPGAEAHAEMGEGEHEYRLQGKEFSVQGCGAPGGVTKGRRLPC